MTSEYFIFEIIFLSWNEVGSYIIPVQNKPVPIVPWNEGIQKALSKPEFALLNKSLGLLPPDGGECLFYRIPSHLCPVSLVNKACLLGPIDTRQ